MGSILLVFIALNVSFYIVLCMLFLYRVKSSNTSSERRFQYLKDVVSTASLSVEKDHPTDHPARKKQMIEQRVHIMLNEQNYKAKAPFTIDALIDESMLQCDTDPKMKVMRFSSEPTTRTQQTPPNGYLVRSWHAQNAQQSAMKGST